MANQREDIFIAAAAEEQCVHPAEVRCWRFCCKILVAVMTWAFR